MLSNREKWLGIFLGILYATLALYSIIYVDFIVNILGPHPHAITWG